MSTLLALSIGCQGSSQSGSSELEKAPAEMHAGAASSESLAEHLEGKIVSTMDGGGYTYVYLDNGTAKIWAAGPQSTFEVGDRVSVETTMPMRDFRSEALDRTFELVYFTRAFGDHAAGGDSHPESSPTAKVSEASHLEIGKIAKAEAGYTVAELWGKEGALGDKKIVVRGQVVKFLPGIMNRNWIHLQDGTGEAESAMITVTTDQQAKVGDVVLVRGQLSREIDFGAGYFYKLIIQDAAITVE